jgi:hypothetical protein
VFLLGHMRDAQPHDPDAEDKKSPASSAGPFFLCRRLLALEGALAGASHPVLARQACALRVAYSNLVGMFDQLREAPAEGCGTKNYEEYLQRHRLSGFVLARTARLPMPNMAPSGSRRLTRILTIRLGR